MPRFRSDEEQMEWLERNAHLLDQNQNQKIIGYKWAPCNDNVHWEIEMYY